MSQKQWHDIDPGDPEFIADPSASYERLRRHSPVTWSERLGAWLFTGYQEAEVVLSDPLFSTAGRVSKVFHELPAGMEGRVQLISAFSRARLGMIEPPDHTRLKRALGRVFTLAAIEKRRQFIQKRADLIINNVLPRGRMDAVQDFAEPLVTLILIDLLNFEATRWPDIQGWANDQSAFYTNDGPSSTIAQRAVRAERAAQAFEEMMREIIKNRAGWAKGTLLHDLVPLVEESRELTFYELIATCLNIVTAGYQPVVSMLTTGLHAPLVSESLVDQVRSDGTVSATLIDELLRYTSPAQLVARTAVKGLEVGGEQIAAGSSCLVSLAAINRDPGFFPSPDEIQPDRSPNRHAAFSIGRHYCLGAQLGRLEAEIAYLTMLTRLPGLRIGPGSAQFTPGTGIRTLRSLPIEWDVR